MTNEGITQRIARNREKNFSMIASEFEDRILSGQMPVGHRLPSEGEIARDFGVSTRSVREAIQILETKGLVRRKHGERTMVVRDDVGEFLGALAMTVRQLFATDAQYLTELMVVRRVIESEALGLLIANKDISFKEVDEAMKAMQDARSKSDFKSFTEADAKFHRALVHAAGNTILSVFYDNLYGLIVELIKVTSSVPSKSYDEAYKEHADIYEMVRRGDEDAAKKLMRDHIDNSAEYLRVAIEKNKLKETSNA